MSNLPSPEVVSFVSTAFVPGENPDNVPQDGNVLDRLCTMRATLELGKTSCEGCVFFDPEAETAEERLCAHQNLRTVLAEQGLEPKDVLMVGLTGDGIGFYDELKADGKISEHRYGWGMIAGYNAMFARASEIRGLGGRAADCSVVKGSAPLPDGDTLMLLLHLTRDNIEGDGALSYGVNGDQSYIQAALAAGAEKYGIAVSNFELEQVAKIDQLDYTFKAGTVKTKAGDAVQVDAEGMMDARFKGWFDQGLLHNTSKPDWKRGDPIEPTDVWVADYQAMTEHVIKNSGVPLENIDTEHAINPGDVTSGHASNAAANDPKRAAYRKRPDARDLYLVTAREKISEEAERKRRPGATNNAGAGQAEL